MMTHQWVSGVIVLAVCYLMLCRVDKMMRGVTQLRVFAQHAALGLCAFTSWVIGFTEYALWSDAVLAAGVLQFFMLSWRRWKYRAPDDTVRGDLEELSIESLRDVVGGSRPPGSS